MFLDDNINQLGQDYFIAGAIIVGNVTYANKRTDGTDDQVQIQSAIDEAYAAGGGLVYVVSNTSVSYALAEVLGGSLNRRIAVQLKDNVTVVHKAGTVCTFQSGGNSGGATFTSVYGNYGNLSNARVVCEGYNAFDGLSSTAGTITDRQSAVWFDARSNSCTTLQNCSFVVTGKRSAGALVRLYNSNSFGTSITKNISGKILDSQANLNALLVERNGEAINIDVYNDKSSISDGVVIADGVENSTFNLYRVVSAGRYGVNIYIDPTISTKFNDITVNANVEASTDHGIRVAGMNGVLSGESVLNQKSGVYFDTVLNGSTYYYPNKLVVDGIKSKNNNQVASTWYGMGGVVKNLEVHGFDCSDTQGSATQYRGIDFSDSKNDYIVLGSGKAQSNTNAQISVYGVNSVVSKEVVGFDNTYTVADGATYTITTPATIYLIGNGSTLKFPKYSLFNSNVLPAYQVGCTSGTGSVKTTQEDDASYKAIDTVTGGSAYNITSGQNFTFQRYSDKWRTSNNNAGAAGTITNNTLSTGVKLDANADENLSLYAMGRQSLLNSNFNQPGLSTANPTNGSQVFRDWFVNFTVAGTAPTTITHSTNTLTAGELAKSYYSYRIAPNGAGSGYAATDYYSVSQRILRGTRFLAGSGKKVTFAINAKSNLTNKKLGVYLVQNYGTGGSPSTAEVINGETYTLTSTFQKFSHTFTLNTLSGKTFGTNNDDYLEIHIVLMWGTGTPATYVGNPGIAETFVGAGNIDFSQTLMVEGDVSLPFQPEDNPILITPTFTGTWAQNSTYTVGFYKDRGRTYLSGVVSGGVIGTSVFTLPVGYRPKKNVFPIARAGSTAAVQVRVQTDGTVYFETGDNGFCPLDGISFENF